ncbi:MAG: glutamate mutase L, partial [Dehalococcoidia bacterium]|nr:glutamate mutase L [Dehalococcoidia bacterium]
MEPDIVHIVSHTEAHHEAKAEDIIESADIAKQVFQEYLRGPKPDIWNDPKVIAREEELKKAAMYNILHLALMGGYEGQVTLDNFFEYAVSKAEAAERENLEDHEKHYETMLLDFVDEGNYPTERCELISPDTLDLALQVGLFQAPQVTPIDKRYEMCGKCRTKIADGTCRIDRFDGKKVKDEFERVDLVRQKHPWYFHKEISVADEVSHISEVEEKIDDAAVEAFRREVGIKSLDNLNVLAVDFGSTFTKVVTFNTNSEEVKLRFVPTTIEDIRIGLASGLGVLKEVEQSGNWKPLEKAIAQYDVRLPCSSAKGGLKMVTVALTKADSGFAAETAALTAGAKLVGSYDGKLTHDLGRKSYEEDMPEIILLAGGTDEGGEVETQLHNAGILAETAQYVKHTQYGVPVIYAGNQDIAEEIGDLFKKHGVDIHIVENIMPEVNT